MAALNPSCARMAMPELLAGVTQASDMACAQTYLQLHDGELRRMLRYDGASALVGACDIMTRFPTDVGIQVRVLHAIADSLSVQNYDHVASEPNAVVQLFIDKATAPGNGAAVRIGSIEVLGFFSRHPMCPAIICAIASAMLAHSDCEETQGSGRSNMLYLSVGDRFARHIIRTGKGIEALVRMPNVDISNTCHLFRLLSDDGAAAQTQMGAAGVVEKLVGYLPPATTVAGYGNISTVVWYALKAINAILLFHGPNTARFVAAGGVDAVAAILPHWREVPFLATVACNVLACVCCDQYQLIDRIRHDAMQALSLHLSAVHDNDLFGMKMLAHARLSPCDYELPADEQRLYTTLLRHNSVDYMDGHERLMLSTVVPWNYGAHKYFPADVRAAIATVLVLARSERTHTRMMTRGLSCVSGSVLNRLLDAIAWLAYYGF